jgi:hypothetical protein
MLSRRIYREHGCALVAYVFVALAYAWPLPLHLATHLPGTLNGDTSVYVWNQWIFRHELVDHRSNPYFTNDIFAASGRADLSLHNYTVLANLLALPLLGWFGVVATFNLIYLAMTVLSAYALFVLARRASGAPEAWLAGVLFAWSPLLVTRGAGHYSLVAAAALPLFVLFLMRVHALGRVRDAVLVGATIALATLSDVYYGVFCVLLAAAYIAVQTVTVNRRPAAAQDERRLPRALDVLILSVGAVIVFLTITPDFEFTLAGHRVRIGSLYTPVLILTVLLAGRLISAYRISLLPITRASIEWTARVTLAAGVTAGVLLSPMLYAVGRRVLEGRMVSPPVFWRSSPAGVDLLAFLLPNPNHPFAPEAWFDLLAQPNIALEHVASVTLVAVLAIGAAWRSGWRPPRLWVVIGLVFLLLALGPFVHVGTVNTYVPGPWALVRYVPIIGLVRTPARFTVVVMLAVAVLFALALRALRDGPARHQKWFIWTVGSVLLFELLPAPRALESAQPPSIYRQIAADPRHNARVLELPFGVRDGASSVGNFTGRSQFYQTVHHKPILGGGLSRVSRQRVSAVRRARILNALIRLSEGQHLSPAEIETLARRAPGFVARTNLAYVVIDRERASPELVDFALRVFRLERLGSDGPFELYRPTVRSPHWSANR